MDLLHVLLRVQNHGEGKQAPRARGLILHIPVACPSLTAAIAPATCLPAVFGEEHEAVASCGLELDKHSVVTHILCQRINPLPSHCRTRILTSTWNFSLHMDLFLVRRFQTRTSASCHRLLHQVGVIPGNTSVWGAACISPDRWLPPGLSKVNLTTQSASRTRPWLLSHRCCLECVRGWVPRQT